MSYFGQVQLRNLQTGDLAYITDFNDLEVAKKVRLVGTTFIGTTKDTNFWTETNAGTGSVTQTAGTVVLATGATANSTTQYQTVRVARFIPGTESVYRAVMKFSNTGTSNNIRRFGGYTANDGAFFQLNGTTMQIGTRAGGSDTVVNQASWNKNTSSFTLDTNYHSFEIHFAYTNFDFYIDGTLVHQVAISGTSTLAAQNLNVNATMENINSGGQTANVSSTFTVSTIFRIGELQTSPIYKNLTTAATTTLKFGAGHLHSVVINNINLNAGTIALFDNTTNSGTLIATITIPKNAALTPIDLHYDVPFSIGLTAVTSVACDITITYE